MNELAKVENGQIILAQELIAELKAVAKAELEIKLKKDQHKKFFENLMREHNIKSFDNDILKITYIPPITRYNIDTKRMKDEIPDIYKEYLKQSVSKEQVRFKYK